MLGPLLALGFLAATPQAPAAPETPAPPAAPVVIEQRVGSVVARRMPDGTVLVSPGHSFVFAPDADESAVPPRWVEMALPAGTKRRFTARSETLVTVPKGTVLEISNLMGDISVDGWNRDEVRVVAEHGRRDRLRARVVELPGRPVGMSKRGEPVFRRRDRLPGGLEHARLQVETLNRMGVPAVVDYTITVPRWMALRLSGMETDIRVAGVLAAIEAESIRGDVEVRGSRGPVQISSVEGEVRAFDCSGLLEASSINETVELDNLSGALEVESVNGDIRIGKVRSNSVEASSVNGSVTYRGTFLPRGRYRLSSHTGNLFVGVPVGAGVDVSVATFEGGFRSGFPVEVGPWRKGQKFNFVLGTGGSSLELESFQGLIELLRPADVPAVAPVPRVRPVPQPMRIVKVKTPRAPKAPEVPGQEEDREPEEDK